MDTFVSFVNNFLDTNVEIFERLREERERLGFKSQTAFAEKVGCHPKSQTNYETGKRSPDAAYLSAIAAAGADVQYILTGTSALTPDERDLLKLFRAAPLVVKASAIGALQGAAGAGKGKAVTASDHSIAVGGDAHINQARKTKK